MLVSGLREWTGELGKEVSDVMCSIPESSLSCTHRIQVIICLKRLKAYLEKKMNQLRHEDDQCDHRFVKVAEIVEGNEVMRSFISYHLLKGCGDGKIRQWVKNKCNIDWRSHGNYRDFQLRFNDKDDTRRSCIDIGSYPGDKNLFWDVHTRKLESGPYDHRSPINQMGATTPDAMVKKRTLDTIISPIFDESRLISSTSVNLKYMETIDEEDDVEEEQYESDEEYDRLCEFYRKIDPNLYHNMTRISVAMTFEEVNLMDAKIAPKLKYQFFRWLSNEELLRFIDIKANKEVREKIKY